MNNDSVFERFRLLIGRDSIWRTQAEMANSLGCTRSQIGSICSKAKKPSATILAKLADNKVSADWILTGKGGMLLEEKEQQTSDILRNLLEGMNKATLNEVICFAQYKIQTAQLQA